MVKRVGGPRCVHFDRPQFVEADRRTALCGAARSDSGGRAARGPTASATRTLAQGHRRRSRTTVIEAFERLVSEGLVESRDGAGTFVSGASDTERPSGPVGDAARPGRQLRVVARDGGCGPAASCDRCAAPRRAPSPPRCRLSTPFRWRSGRGLPAKHWRGSRGTCWATAGPFGHPRRCAQAIAAHLRGNRGIACDGGADLHRRRRAAGVHLIGQRAARSRRPRVVRESGRDRRAQQLHRLRRRSRAGAGRRRRLGGRRRATALGRDFRLVFVTPSHQQPLGCTMSLERRFALLRAAEQAGAWIVEDDYDGEFFYGRPPAADPEERRSHRAA